MKKFTLLDGEHAFPPVTGLNNVSLAAAARRLEVYRTWVQIDRIVDKLSSLKRGQTYVDSYGYTWERVE